MGRFVNSNNSAFADALNSQIYVDKTELLEYTNSVIDTTSKYICNSRPRRFGKSITADMLTAYYSKGCESESATGIYRIFARIVQGNRADKIYSSCIFDGNITHKKSENTVSVE